MRKAVHAVPLQDAPAPATGPGPDHETAKLLARLHVELAALAKGVLTTQHVLGPILSQLPTMPAEAIAEAQRLDLIEQSLRDLAAVASAASETADALDLRAISNVCLLADLGARLRGDALEGKPSADLELF